MPTQQDLRDKAYQWRGIRRFLTDGYRVSFSKKKTGHWHGGVPEHSGAKCYCCKKPLRLIWSINVSDNRFSPALKQRFPDLSHLPLYYCFNCPEATTYRIVSSKSIRCIAPQRDGGDETPYNYDVDVPLVLPRKPVSLARVPSIIDALLTLESEVGFDALDSAARKELEAFVGSELLCGWHCLFSQFGGQPMLIQGHDDLVCANPRCPSKKFESNGDAYPGMYLKELAVVSTDGLAGFTPVFAPISYHVCWCCGTVEGCFQCS